MSLGKYGFIGLLLGCVSFIATAAVYKSVDANGVVQYSDSPAAGGEKVELTALHTTKMRELSRDATREGTESNTQATPDNVLPPWSYNELSISQPTAEKTLQHIGGTLAVEVLCQPRLYPGDVLKLSLDGATVMQQVENNPVTEKDDLAASVRISMTLKNVWRGDHTLQASVVRDGKPLLASTSVQFYVKQNSILIPKQ